MFEARRSLVDLGVQGSVFKITLSTTAQFVNLSTDDLHTVASTTQMRIEDSAENALQSKPEQQQANRATLKLLILYNTMP